MAYTPTDATLRLPSGMRGNATGWTRVCENHNEVYVPYQPPLLVAGGSLDDLLVIADTADLTLSTSYTTYLRWLVPRDLDDVPVTVTILWRADAAASLRITCGSNSDEASTGGASWVLSTISVVPDGTAGDAPILGREMLLEAKADSGSATVVEIVSVTAHYEPSLVPSGVQPSGWVRMPDLADDADEPVPSERVARMTNGPGLISRDRPVCVATLMQDTSKADLPLNKWSSTGTTWRTVQRFSLPARPQEVGLAPTSTRYAVAMYVGGTNPWEVELSAPGSFSPVTVSGSSGGWYYGTIGWSPGLAVHGLIRIRYDGSFGGGVPVSLHTLQVFRIGDVT